MNLRRMAMVLGVAGLILSGCSGDDDDALRQENETLSSQVAALREERDLVAARYEGSSATIESFEAILADPESFGTEAAIVDAIDDLAVEGALIEDDVFGSIDYRTGYYQTLFSGDVDAVIDVYDHWLSADGSQGGSLWVWHGTNVRGNPFELIGISLIDFDEAGKIAHELVTYPYPDEYVVEAFEGVGTIGGLATDS